MPLFRLATEIVQSSVPFPELLSASGNPSLYFSLGVESEWPAPPDRWIRSVEVDDGRVWVAIGKVNHAFLFSFPRYCDFLLSPDTGEITCYPRSSTDIDTVRHLVLDHVFPLVLSWRNLTVLHASAVADRFGGALIFLGQSGAGKSTFAASLCKEEGFSLLADDCLVTEIRGSQAQAISLYPGLRLWDNSAEHLRWDSSLFPAVAQYTNKKRIPIADTSLRYESEPVPISAIFVLNPDGEAGPDVQLRNLPLREGMIRLLESSFCLDPENKQKNEVDFHRLSKLAQSVPMIQVNFPYDFSQFAQVREAVLSAPVRR